MEATLSSKNQIVIPREARDRLGVKAGDKLLIVVRGNHIIILTKPQNYGEAIRGLAKEPSPEDYLDRERDSWD
jgi:AbrB family looped-hinge helix DNA binding protein